MRDPVVVGLYVQRMNLGLSADQLVALRRTAANSGYHLFMGAGAAIDSLSSDGRNLPLGGQLADELAQAFDVEIEDGDQLWRIYSRATAKHSDAVVYAWLRKRFHNVQPPAWMETYARFPWQCVWTLNLDDSFEKSYDRVRTESSLPLRIVSWDDEYVMNRDLSVVHLHGHVFDNDPRKLVFSLAEYADAAVARAPWPVIFRDVYGVTPMVIIGARLRDEPDIESIVARRLPEHDAPSFYVSPRISSGMRSDLAAWRLIPVEMTGQEFASEWAKLCDMDLSRAPSRPEELSIRVAREFRELTTDKPIKIPVGHDLLGGDEPRWDDIRAEIPAELDWFREGKSLVRQFGQPLSPSTILMYSGQRLSGRSTGLLAIAFAFKQASWRVFLYTADERPDIDAIIQYASDGKSVLLVFDGIADIAEDAEEVIRRSRASGLRISILAVDSNERNAGIVGRINPHYMVGNEIKAIRSLLTRTDAARLVDRLAAAGRLGRLERKRDRDRLAHFRNRELFTAMSEIENAPGFGARVDAEVNAIDNQAHLELLFFASMAARVGRRLYIVDASRMVKLPTEEIVRAAQGSSLNAVISIHGGVVHTRQRWLALSSVITKIGGDRKSLQLLASGVQQISSRLSRSSQRERNGTSLLVGNLMTYRNLAQIFPSSNLEGFYNSLQPSFGHWSGRFWEQRAIMSRHLGDVNPDALPRAESYAQRAVTLVEDTYSYTTLGTVLAARGAVADAGALGEYYDRTFDAFEKAGELDPQNLVTWFAFLNHTLKLLDRVASGEGNDDVRDRLIEDWRRIHDNIASTVAASESTKHDLAGLLARYERITLKGKRNV